MASWPNLHHRQSHIHTHCLVPTRVPPSLTSAAGAGPQSSKATLALALNREPLTSSGILHHFLYISISACPFVFFCSSVEKRMRRNVSSSKARFSSSSFTATSVLYANQNYLNTPPSHQKPILVPIDSPPSEETAIAIPVLLPESVRSAAAARIQAAYRSHMVRALVREIRAVDAEAGRFEELIRRQETVDAVRSDDRARVRLSEGLMALLLRLDSVQGPGVDQAVRNLRRGASRRIVALQEVLDAVSEARVVDADGFPPSWEDIMGGGDCFAKEREGERVSGRFGWEEKGLGLECLERFLWRLSV